MEAQYKTSNGRLVFKVTAENAKAMFQEIARVQDVFEAESACGACSSENIRFVARKVEDFEYHELQCLDCGAAFRFGQSKTGGGLFPKRKDDQGVPLPNRGWQKYNKQLREK